MSVGVGILGFAHGHVNAYLKGWAAHSEWDVSAVCGWDHDSKRLTDAAETHGIELCESAEQLLARDDISAVVIAAETNLHADLAVQAAAAGKAIIMQKPLALTVDEADRVVKAVNDAGVAFTMCWQMRVDEQNLQAKQWIDEGAIGRVYMVRRRHGLPTQAWGAWFEESWHVDPASNRGMWADDASHAIDFLLWLLGKPKSVIAEIDTLRSQKVPDDNGIAIFRYEDGTMAEVMCSFTLLAGENTLEVVGEKGVIIQNYGDGPSCASPRPSNAPGLKMYLHETGDWQISDLPVPAKHGERIAALGKPLAEFLHGKRDAIATVEEGRTSLHMTLACYDAAKDGCRFKFD